jgi:hypothetical protein
MYTYGNLSRTVDRGHLGLHQDVPLGMSWDLAQQVFSEFPGKTPWQTSIKT